MKPYDKGWQSLVAAARQHRDDRDESAPYGFATRVAALAMTERVTVRSVFEKLSWRVLGVAAALAIVSVATNYRSFASGTGSEEDVISNDSAVAALFDVS
jgi:hypothetical protein